MRKITLLLVGILFMLLANGQSQTFLHKVKSSENLKSKNPSVEVVKTHMNQYLKTQQTQANRKSENADTPTLDSILVEITQFDETDFETDRYGYNENGLNTYFNQEFYTPAYDDLHYYNNENYFYNEYGLEDYRTYQSGDSESGLEESRKVNYKYNDEQLLDTIFYTELSSDFIFEYYGVMEYNELNQISSTVVWYEPDGMAKIKMMQEDYYYNSTNSKVENIKTYENNDGENLSLVLSTTFNYNGDLLAKVSGTMFNDGEVVEVNIESYTYNENNIPTEWIYLASAFGENYEMKYEIIYENNDAVISPIMFNEQLRLNFLDFGRLAKLKLFDKIDGEWNDIGFANFYYSDSIYNVTSIPTTPKISSLNVYPNPANNLISIDIQTDEPCDVNFYDVSGKLVMQSLHAAQNIDITSLKAGYYLVQVHSNGNVLGSSKLLKK